MTVDFEVAERLRPTTAAEVASALAALDGRAARLAGRATMQDRVPPPDVPVVLVELAALDRIVRLDAGDLTCSVEPGVTREALDAALAEHRLVLPCAAAGTTLGGLFARSDGFALGPGGFPARALLLGIEAVLAEGLRFKAGGRVVKNVAGYDLPKLFVGSRGRLFAATLLHLKLRPLPERALRFALRGLDRGEAVARFRSLRRLASPPSALVLARDGAGSFEVAGCLEGRARVVAEQARALELEECDAPPCGGVTAAPGAELICGTEVVTRLDPLLDALPAGAPLRYSGAGRFEVALSPADADRALAALAAGGTAAELWCAPRGRRGRNTGGDERAARLAADLARALDPQGTLR